VRSGERQKTKVKRQKYKDKSIKNRAVRMIPPLKRLSLVSGWAVGMFDNKLQNANFKKLKCEPL